ncbi:MAG TPA: hypothetical protein VMZ74_17180 [Ramlibacter sp.]|nr:hypothetical protein [Ramlibacter sp.]
MDNDDVKDDKDDKDTPKPLPTGPFSGIEEFRQLVRNALAAAARENWREIILSDQGFVDWPLGERAVAESLAAWSQSGRKCILLARRWDQIGRHARFVTWRSTWSHIIDARACPSADPLELPSAIWTPTWAMQRRDLDNSRGYMGTEADRRLTLRENLNEWLSKSTPSFPSSTSGL